MALRDAERRGFAGRDPEAMDVDLAHARQQGDASVVVPFAGAADRDDEIGVFVGERAFERTHEDHIGAMRRDAA